MGVYNETTNNGFDNDQNEYIVRLNEHLGYRYEVIKKIGKGSFGAVMRCYDHKEKEYIALKILKNKKRLQTGSGRSQTDKTSERQRP